MKRGSAWQGWAGLGKARQGLGVNDQQSMKGNKMKTYLVEITGKTPLLMHHDNIEWADFMDEWKNSPENKKGSKAGDDRSPAWRWIGSTYHDGKILVIPNANIMRCIMEGGAMVPVPGGKMGKTFKSQTQSGMMSVETFWPVTTADGRTVKFSDIERLKDEDEFANHRAAVRALGFELNIKRAKIGTSKHVRVRPEFASGWKATGHLSVWDEQITDEAIASILTYAGQYKGLGDWRPGGKTPGPYGTFDAKVKRIS